MNLSRKKRSLSENAISKEQFVQVREMADVRRVLAVVLACRYCIGSDKDGPLLSGSVRQFVESLSARSPTPGGGSASACIASMAAALGTMVR